MGGSWVERWVRRVCCWGWDRVGGVEAGVEVVVIAEFELGFLG